MKVIVTKSYEDSSRVVADIIGNVIKEKANAKLGLATGGSAEGVYACLVKDYEDGKLSFKDVSTVNLDEYIGIDPSHDQSYRYFMNKHLFSKVDVDIDKTFVVRGNQEIESELELFKNKINDGAIDVQLLGVGVSGHIGFNEAGDHLIASAHVEELDESTIEANSRYFDKKEDVPTKAITMGVGEIMKAKKLVLIASGSSKAYAMKALLMNDVITPQVPCTVLKMHSDATVVIDEALADEIGYKY